MSYMRSEERRSQILDKAVGVFAQKGYEQASIANICEASGIARGTLYQYFPNKQHLFRSLLEEYASKLTGMMQPFRSMGLPPPRCAEDLETILTMRLIGIYRIIIADEEMYALLLKEAMSKNADTENIVQDIHRTFVDLIMSDIQDAQAIGIVAVDNAEFAAVAVLGSILNLCMTYVLDRQGNVPSADELGRRTAVWLMRGLGIDCCGERRD